MDLETNPYFRFNVIMLKGAGLWVPNKNESIFVKIFYCIWNTFWVTYTCAIFTTSELLYLKNSASDLPTLIKNLNMGMTHLLAVMKVYIWYRKRKEIFDIVKIMSDYSQSYEEFEDFVPKKIFEKEKFIKNIGCKGFLSAGCGVGISACLTSLQMLYWNKMDDPKNFTSEICEKFLPYPSVVPVNYGLSKSRCAMVIVYQSLAVYNSAWLIIGFDSMFVAQISYVSSHLLLIQGAFRTIRQRCLRELELPNVPNLHDSDVLSRVMIAEMNRITKHLQVIFEICERIESLYTYVTLGQILISLVVFCTCLFLVSSIPFSNARFYAEVVYMIAIQAELANYCFFGNNVTLSCEGMCQALYEGDWFAASASFKRSMLITMTRMQKPIYFTIGNFSPLTLSTLVTISRGSYSYFAVLKNSETTTQ